MGMVKRRGNTKAQVTVENFEELKLGFLLYLENIIEMEEVLPAMVLNWDHTAVNYVPVFVDNGKGGYKKSRNCCKR